MLQKHVYAHVPFAPSTSSPNRKCRRFGVLTLGRVAVRTPGAYIENYYSQY
jgi:hypothetical protein